jgi:hypothetical protein
MLTGVCHAYTAADYAINPPYSSGWSAGQNGGYGFGPWSFNGTDMTPPGQYQGIGVSSPIGTAWTELNQSSTTGIANSGRGFNPMYVGQTLETVVENPTGYHFFRGWDILLSNGPDNNPAGNNSAGLFLNVFGYGGLPNWTITDGGGSKVSTVSPAAANAGGMKVDFTLTAGNTYALTLTPLANPLAAYSTTGTLAGSNPISWINFRLYNTMSSGLGDTANNFGMSYITITPEPSSLALLAIGASGLAFFRRRK